MMKKLLLIPAFIGSLSLVNAQIVNDNKVSFGYIQLPQIKVDDAFTNYEVKVVHGYLVSNQDSLAAFELNKRVSIEVFESMMAAYHQQNDSIESLHLRNMATWQTKVNAGLTQSDGTALPQPIRPIGPIAPVYPRFDSPLLHADYSDDAVTNAINIEGFTKGLGGFVVTADIQAMENMRISYKKSGTGSATKYTYTAYYKLPVLVTVESPTQGKIIYLRILEGIQSYKLGDYKTTYDFELYRNQNKAKIHSDVERAARIKAIRDVSNYLNDQIGYLKRRRTAEIYSVRKFKDYDYSDVTSAYSLSIQALNQFANDRYRDGAMDQLDQAIAAWKEVLLESNSYDKKARINNKITSMIQCNLAELYAWKGEYAEADLNVNLAINGGGKFKRHAQAVRSFYANQKNRWNANQ
ncbi:MAG: hypothetical protein MK066_07240 [Crocinitomicaceae bacterium]|nr:hypothetical protein [Crocinitomicaceae bacterium]